MLKSLRILACSLLLVGLVPLAAWAHNVLVSPDNFPRECSDDLFDEAVYSGPVSAYTVRNLKMNDEDKYKISFQISASKKIEFYTEFRRDLENEAISQINSYIKKKKGLFVAFVQPGSARLGPNNLVPASSEESRLDFFLIGVIPIGNGNPPVCSVLSATAGLPKESYHQMPENIRLLMDRSTKAAMANAFANGFLALGKQQTGNVEDLPEVTVVP